MIRFVDHPISERISIIQGDGNSIHVYEILSKHYGESVELLKDKFSIEVNVVRNFITITSNMENICELVEYLYSYSMDFISITLTSLEIELHEFFRKLY